MRDTVIRKREGVDKNASVRDIVSSVATWVSVSEPSTNKRKAPEGNRESVISKKRRFLTASPSPTQPSSEGDSPEATLNDAPAYEETREDARSAYATPSSSGATSSHMKASKTRSLLNRISVEPPAASASSAVILPKNESITENALQNPNQGSRLISVDPEKVSGLQITWMV